MDYTRTFDESNVNWIPDLAATHLFFARMQAHLNNILRNQGHLFLNEVYDRFGLSRTKEGQTVGWKLDIHNANHPNQVRFELMPNYETNAIQIEFQGLEDILDVLESETSRLRYKKRILRFAASSEFPEKFVALDSASGGYPYAVEEPTQAQFWDSDQKALDYAKSFSPESKSYSAYAIEPVVHIMTVEVSE